VLQPWNGDGGVELLALYPILKFARDVTPVLASFIGGDGWLYEREWRMFAGQGKVAYGRLDCVTQVFIGARIDSKHRTHLRKALNGLKIKISEMSVSRYSIKFK
jgi:hypothetical protein